jgi:hypothetical protein
VDAATKQLLARWRRLEGGDGLKRAVLTSRVLFIVGLALLLFVFLAVVYQLHPVLIAFAAAAMGWVIAERNALRTRLAQWAIFKRYIDWKRVHEDSRDAA